MSYIAEFTGDIRYVKGVENTVADTLSCVEAVSVALSYAELAEDQAKSAELQELRSADNALVLQDEDFGGVTVLCDVATGTRRPLIPAGWRRKVFDLVHGLSHAGPRPTTKAVANRFVWPQFKKDIRDWCKTCESCQLAKVATHVSAPLTRREPPDRRFGSLHLDLVGPLPESGGMRYLMTIVDRFTRWMEAILIPDKSANTCARAFLRH